MKPAWLVSMRVGCAFWFVSRKNPHIVSNRTVIWWGWEADDCPRWQIQWPLNLSCQDSWVWKWKGRKAQLCLFLIGEYVSASILNFLTALPYPSTATCIVVVIGGNWNKESEQPNAFFVFSLLFFLTHIFAESKHRGGSHCCNLFLFSLF